MKASLTFITKHRNEGQKRTEWNELLDMYPDLHSLVCQRLSMEHCPCCDEAHEKEARCRQRENDSDDSDSDDSDSDDSDSDDSDSSILINILMMENNRILWKSVDLFSIPHHCCNIDFTFV